MYKNSKSYIKLNFATISERPDYTVRFANSDTEYHHHNDWYEFILVTQGSFEHTYNKHTEVLERGALLLFDINQGHRLNPTGNDCIHFALCLSPHYFEGLLHMFLFDNKILSEKKYIQLQLDEAASPYFIALTNALSANESDTDSVKLFFYNAMSHLLSHTSGTYAENPDVVDDICEKIKNYSYLNANMTDVYKMYPYSAPTIIKKFKERTGMTPVRYQTEVKLQYAARLLRETPQSTEQIISSLGFHSSSHFYELFKSYFGTTPNIYREEIQK